MDEERRLMLLLITFVWPLALAHSCLTAQSSIPTMMSDSPQVTTVPSDLHRHTCIPVQVTSHPGKPGIGPLTNHPVRHLPWETSHHVRLVATAEV